MSPEDFKEKYKRVEKPSTIMRWFGDRTREEQAIRPAILERYKKVKENHGDLFEKNIQTIGAEETESIRKRKQKALRRVYLVGVAFVLVIGFLTVIEPAEIRQPEGLEIFEVFFFAAGIFGFWYFTKKNFDRILELKEKEVIKGVITDKVRATEIRDSEEGALFFELSQQEMVQVWSDDYKKYTLGDCVQIEILSDDVLVKRKVFKTGQLPAS